MRVCEIGTYYRTKDLLQTIHSLQAGPVRNRFMVVTERELSVFGTCNKPRALLDLVSINIQFIKSKTSEISIQKLNSLIQLASLVVTSRFSGESERSFS
jgi:hypothetical protein